MNQKKYLKHTTAFVIPLALALMAIAWASQKTTPNFNAYPAGPERKQVFFDYFLPLIEQQNQSITNTREQLIAWNNDQDAIGWWSRYKLSQLAENYRMETFDIDNQKDWDTLLKRVDIVPASLALAQAAKESGWGTSRFGHEGNNFYGQWCFKTGCGIVPGNRAQGKQHELAVFDSPAASVKSYIHNLNSHRAYKNLRNIRAELRNNKQLITGLKLAKGLSQYSERGVMYVKEVRSLIRQNQLAGYDVN